MSNRTIDYYNKNAEIYKLTTQKLDFTKIYAPFLNQLPSNALILDFGCGSGRDTKYFLGNGYQVEAIDGSVEMCKIASAYTEIEVKQMLFDDLAEEEKYMGIWACASVLHLQKENLKIVLKKMHTALKEDGVVYISFKYGDFSGEKAGRYFTDFTERTFSELIWEIGGFSIIDLWKTDDHSLNMREETWLNVLLKKRNVHDELIGRDLDKEKLDLARKGVDFWNASYSQHADFMKLKENYYFDNNRHIRADLLVEQSLGQKHLEKLYGAYSIKIKRPLAENEASEDMFYNHLKEEFGYYDWSIYDVKKWFWRKELERAGLCIRLIEWGLDINAFDDNSEKFRLMKFLYHYEYDKGVRFKNFLGNPTMENADQSRIKHKTHNGEIMNDLKENVAVMIDGNYVSEVKQSLYFLLSQWEVVMRNIAKGRGATSSDVMLNELKQFYDRIERLARSKDSLSCEDREESLYKQFYLKLCIHEIIGREYDIIDVIESALKYNIIGNEITSKDNVVWIAKDELEEYCKNNRKRLAKIIYDKDRLSSNNYRDFDKAVKKACRGISFFWKETGFRNYEKIPEYLLIISIQEVLVGDMKDKVENHFYRYKTSDQKTLSTELSAEEAFDKSKFAWIERVKKRVNRWNVPMDVYNWEKKVELQIENIILKILDSNSREAIKNKNEKYLALINWLAITQEQLQSVRDIIRVQTGFQLKCEDSFAERIFLGFLWDSEDLLESWLEIFVIETKRQMDLQNKSARIEYPYTLEYYNDRGVCYVCKIILKVDFAKQEIIDLSVKKLEILKYN